MRWQLELVSGPSIEALELARVKREIDEYADITTRDDDIEAKIQAAREWVEDYTGLVLVDSTWRLSIERTGSLFNADPDVGRVFSGAVGPTRDVYLRRSPLLAITSVVTVDADGAETAVAEADYEIRGADSKWPMLVPINTGDWGSSNIRVTFRAGYAERTGSPQQDASVIPERLKQAMILWIDGLHNKKFDSTKAAHDIAKPLRIHLGFA